MIEINKVEELVDEMMIDLNDDKERNVDERVKTRVRNENDAKRAGKQMANEIFEPTIDRERIKRREDPLRVRQRKIRITPGKRLAFALVLTIFDRIDDRKHADVRIDDDRLAKARRLRKFQIMANAFMHRMGVGERDTMDRAIDDREAVVLMQLGARMRERMIGGEVDDGAMQRPRTHERDHIRPEHEWTHTMRHETILRIPNIYFAKLRMPAEFFTPWRCICGRWRISRSVASTRRSAQMRNASRPRRRVSSTIRSSAASASFNSPSSPSTASTIDDTRLRSSGCARNVVISASSLNSPTDTAILNGVVGDFLMFAESVFLFKVGVLILDRL